MSNQSILKEISPGRSLEGLMLKLKLQYFGHLMQRVDSLENTLMLGGIRVRTRGWQRMRWLNGITDSWAWVNSGSWWWTGRPGVLQSMGSQRVGHNWATKLNWEYDYWILWENYVYLYNKLSSCLPKRLFILAFDHQWIQVLAVLHSCHHMAKSGWLFCFCFV